MKKQLFLISIITAAFFVLIFHKTIFQEGNPLPIAWSIVKLKSSGEDVVQISDKPKRYLIHSNDYLTFIKQMKKKKVNFQYQDNKKFYFNNDNERQLFVSKNYTDKFTIMELKKKELTEAGVE
ncbi:hypothetical protein IHQ11_04525 [Priestia megaterium]|uniref:hypothetical protein n=1 Tax=Priestia megaterium TaxID=1404 RepID=UPI001B39E712|nr:hypothetical protein [Priestia megaterium]MBQ4865776.1 hypothetical protein [Priestia megaterium]MEB2272706.1 hypothetical protein [Bacillus sp. ILBB4]